MAGVVVGVDGSAHARAALRLAAMEARCRSTGLHVVFVYEPVRSSDVVTAAAVVGSGMWTPDVEPSVLREASRRDQERKREAQRHAEGMVRQMVTDAAADLEGLDVSQTAIGDEHPSAALLRLSQHADLLVVGSRGLGGFRGLLMGSVSQQCVQHATCPTLVVRSSSS